ncbi:TrlF family AAA-like ATPase [Cohnella panacarvi]|uniref:TrlF family AAA-like ATPase n=1 Tax=Cohnella panacarvi TaxID=400776 RepID=UPI00047ECEE3|nr:PHP domain-containing protein [Cohnella panacarvi]
MSPSLQSVSSEITNHSSGAEFKRADLHIHSFGDTGSYDVKDSNMTPENIIDTAISENLKVISVTDHNSIGNVKRALDYSKDKDILVIPGVELSTPQGHLLVYLPTFEKLTNFFGKLNISDNKVSCYNTIPQCLQIANEYGGFGVAAHIDLDTGFESMVNGYPPFKEEILVCKNLLAFEISNIQSVNWYSNIDTNPDRKRLLETRKRALNEENTYELAKVMSSDAHTLSALGKNAAGSKKLTRLKMESLTFEAFRIALLDSSARVRIEDLIPESIPKFIGIKFDGGFLDGQVINFSKNLTCIIGGRGTGKSTTLESVRAASGNTARKNLLDSEVWPDRIALVYEDQTGRQQLFVRDKNANLINITNPEDGLTQIQIESYGQGETADTIQHCDKDPGILLRFLDEFIDFGTIKTEENEMLEKLLANQTEIERASLQVKSIPDIQKAKLNAEEQLNTLKAQNAKEVVELEESLVKERTFRTQLVDNLNVLVKTISESLSDKTILNQVLELDGATLVAGQVEFSEVKKIVERFSTFISGVSGNINDELKNVISGIKLQLKSWTTKEAETQTKIENLRKALEARGIKLDMGFIRKITQDVYDYTQKLAELEKKKKEMEEKQQERKELLKQRRELKNKIYMHRVAFAKKMNDNLATSVVDYFVNIKFVQGIHSPELQQIIKDAMNWKTSQIPRASYIANKYSPIALLELIKSKNTMALINEVVDANGNKIFSLSEAENILITLSEASNLFKIERCNFEDLPEIKITRVITDESGNRKHSTRDFSRLSLGQQQSILLTVLLYSKSNCPLIIDQPEDNLDSEFIYKTLVKSLRKVKEHRQVIIVTHNANIAVLGDAELIIPLRSTNEKTVITSRGSIDTVETKKITCAILEGSEQAFKKRKEIYGI